MKSTYAIETRRPPSAGTSAVRVEFSASATGEPGRIPRDMPASIPASQAYYWSVDWQEDEREALVEIRQGKAFVFSDPLEAVRWLFSPDE